MQNKIKTTGLLNFRDGYFNLKVEKIKDISEESITISCGTVETKMSKLKLKNGIYKREFIYRRDVSTL